MIEFFEDLIERDPMAEFPRDRIEDGTFEYKTSDPVFNEWSKQLAEGKIPDLTASFTDADRRRLARINRKRHGTVTSMPSNERPALDDTLSPEEFHDTYQKDV